MPWITVGGKSPADHGAAFVAENATLAGSVRLEEGASIWYGAVLRADTGRIVVGAGSNVQDNAVLDTGPELDIVLGRGVSVGHNAVLHGCMIGDGCMIGMMPRCSTAPSSAPDAWSPPSSNEDAHGWPPRGQSPSRGSPPPWSCRTAASFLHQSSTSPTISGSSAEVGSSNSSTSGFHGQRPHNGHTLLLPAGKLG